jgi:O-antigen/teichoic acid export membrane protein
MLKDGLDNVAYYAVAFYIASVILIPARALVLPSMPILAEAWKKREHAKIDMIYRRSAAIQLVIGAYLFLCLWAGADVLFSLMKPGYSIAKNAMLILGFVNVINLAGGLSGGIVATSRSYWFDALSGAVLVILNVVLDFAFIKAFGMVGAAWSSLVAFTSILAWRIVFLKRKHGLWPFDARTVITMVLGLALAIVLLMLPQFGGSGWTSSSAQVLSRWCSGLRSITCVWRPTSAIRYTWCWVAFGTSHERIGLAHMESEDRARVAGSRQCSDRCGVVCAARSA